MDNWTASVDDCDRLNRRCSRSACLRRDGLRRGPLGSLGFLERAQGFLRLAADLFLRRKVREAVVVEKFRARPIADGTRAERKVNERMRRMQAPRFLHRGGGVFQGAKVGPAGVGRALLDDRGNFAPDVLRDAQGAVRSERARARIGERPAQEALPRAAVVARFEQRLARGLAFCG